jgi:hypothetical protein
MDRGAVKVYLLLGALLIALILAVVAYTQTTANSRQVKIVSNTGSEMVTIEPSIDHSTDTFMGGNISVALNDNTIAALILGSLLLVTTISLSAVKIISWRRKASDIGTQQPRPTAPTAPTSPTRSQPTASFPDSAHKAALELAVIEMMARDKGPFQQSSQSDPGTDKRSSELQLRRYLTQAS